MHNVILLSSDGQKLGKTELAKTLVKEGICCARDSFAIYIKKLSLDLHKGVSYDKYNSEEFYQTVKDKKVLNGFTPRDLFCDLSELVQKFYGEEVWAQHLHDLLEHDSNKDTDKPYCVVIDDWRRLIESNYFEEKQKFNLIKVYLQKEGYSAKKLKGSSGNYEGKISPSDCDIVFKFKEDYSNTPELIDAIKSFIK